MNTIEIIEKLISIFLSFVLLANAYFLKRKTGTWLFPSCIFSLLWFAYIFLPLLILYQIPVSIQSQLFITTSIILFSVSYAFFNWKQAYSVNQKKIAQVSTNSIIGNESRIMWVMICAIILSILTTLIHIANQEINILNYLVAPIRTAEQFAIKRYALALNNTIATPLSLIFSNLAVLIAGVLYLQAKTTIKKIAILSCFLPSLLILITQSAKGLFFLSVFMFLGGLYVSIHRHGLQHINTKKIIRNTKLFLITAPLLLIFSFLSRGFNASMSFTDALMRMKQLFSSYILAHVYSFSDWFNAYCGNKSSTMTYDISNNYYGFYTFNSITRYFDADKENIRGVYKEYYRYADVLETNVYTVFRGMIMDFTVIGALVVMFLFGFCVHKYYYALLTKREPLVASIILIFSIAFFYMSFLGSLLYWSVIPASFLIFYIVLKINKLALGGKKNS